MQALVFLKSLCFRAGIGIACLLIYYEVGFATEALSLDNGDRLLVPFYWAIERRHLPPDCYDCEGFFPRSRSMILGLRSVVKIDPTEGEIVIVDIPAISPDSNTTDNKGTIRSPKGMTTCNAKPIGTLEASHAVWSAMITRNQKIDGLSYYTSVGTSPGMTHRLKGTFYVEFVKPVQGWQAKYSCLPDRAIVWNIHD